MRPKYEIIGYDKKENIKSQSQLSKEFKTSKSVKDF